MSEPKIPGGYIMLSRKIIESEIMNKPPLYIKVWVYLLASAQHSDYRNLKRGQLVTSLPEIMEACSWMVGYRKVKPKKDQVYQVINWLRTVSRSEDESNYEGDTNATMITTTKATHGMLVNIENYDFYQTPANYESNSETYDENRTTTTRKQRQPNNINKNDKNDKNDKEDSSLSVSSSSDQILQEIEKHFIQRRQSGFWIPDKDRQAMLDLLEDGFSFEEIVQGIKQAYDNYRPRYKGDKIDKFTYCERVIRSNRYRREQDNQGGVRYAKGGRTDRRDPGTNPEDAGGGYYEQFDNLFAN